uniref:Peptidase S1 domain-containing protein n=1 Tax=Caenorhabditis tropicalis TaxID=1561998 RepID=A0A1I7UXU1_9PELO
MDNQDGKNLTFSEKDGLVKVETINVTEPYPTMGFFISKRHILTSAHSVLTKNLEWRFGGNPWDKNSGFPQDVPNDVRGRLRVQLGDGCGNDCAKRIISVKEYMKTEQWVCVPSYYTLDARGGPLLKNVSGKATVIGLTANTEIDKPENYVYFFDLGSYSKVICDSSGVCAAKEETTTISNTITVPSEENTTENRKTSSSKIPNSQTANDKESTKKPINLNIDGYGLDEKDVESEDIWKDIRDTNEYYLRKNNRKSSNLFSLITYFFALSSIYF